LRRDVDPALRQVRDPLLVELGQLAMRLARLGARRTKRPRPFLLLTVEQVVQVVHLRLEHSENAKPRSSYSLPSSEDGSQL
jgi:hypothetical protein